MIDSNNPLWRHSLLFRRCMDEMIPVRKEEKYRPTHIDFHPQIIEWAKAEAESRGMK